MGHAFNADAANNFFDVRLLYVKVVSQILYIILRDEYYFSGIAFKSARSS